MKLQIGSSADSWGIWFADDPKQMAWPRFLDEVVEAGYEWIEIGPYGYLPTDPAVLGPELERRGLKAVAGVVILHLEDPAVRAELEDKVRACAALMKGVGAEIVVLIDDVFTDVWTGEPTAPRTLSPEQWRTLIDNVEDAAAVATEAGAELVFHPHADTHVETEADIERFLHDVDPAVKLCLDTGHHAYADGDPVAFLRKHADRISHLHVKNVDPEVQPRVRAEGIPFGRAVGLGVFCEPWRGLIDFAALRDALEEVGYDRFVVVEQDLYPAPLDAPLPIARKTREYLRDVGIG